MSTDGSISVSANVRDDFGPQSDVDVLVEFQAGHVPGLAFVSMERDLSGLLEGRRVDMVTPKFLNPRILRIADYFRCRCSSNHACIRLMRSSR